MKLKRNDLLAKLSSGHMIAIEAKYRVLCHSIMTCGGEVHVVSLVSYLEEHRDSGETAPVFKLADLKSLYSEKLQEFGINPLTPKRAITGRDDTWPLFHF